tara:strand:+ start:287 stop:868 length:582 start_codon:yes stop_codon:yes gene_type:complete
MKKIIILLMVLLINFDLNGKPTNILKLTCEYDPTLIKIKQKNIGFLKDNDLNRTQVCRMFGCNDEVEVNKYDKTSEGKNEYRLRNSWFNHQGILLDDYVVEENIITINTFVSQAYFLESYHINRKTGKTKRTFYRFDHPQFFNEIQKLENDNSKNFSLYNKKGKISLKTLKMYSLEPWETTYFEGKCLAGTGV